MSDAQPWNSAGGDQGMSDIVGERVLAGIQMVDISRLSTHPVPIISRGLITVAGQGPKDSNGAGKSSFIAALSLLHADEQWRLTSGATGAAELLFTAELAAQEGHWSNADRGYIIGVFAAADHGTVEDLHASTLTVWLRINRKAPHLDLRWRQGLHVPLGASDDERARQVDALWEELPRSNGRTDIHANRLATVLYGSTVRCVSFLSTSVRASPTANLLAQPLNDLSPERIFDAIATLTGLDRELEHEQALRSTEHAHTAAVRDAEQDLEAWEREIGVVEAGIAHRARARELLGAARASWHGRCARYLLDGIDRADTIRTTIARLAQEIGETESKIETAEQALRTLKDDTEFSKRFNDRERRYKELAGRDRELERALDTAAAQIEDLTKRHRQQLEQAAVADGRSIEQAQHEEGAATIAWETAIKLKGAAEAGVAQAQRDLTAAESGDDVAAEQIGRLRKANVPAAALLDVVQLDVDQRLRWEPRLIPYRTAVVIGPTDLPRAREILLGLPGSMLIIADPPDTPQTTAHLPRSADSRFTVSVFLAALDARADPDPSSLARIDAAAGVVVVEDFPEPVTGRATRIAAARAALKAAGEELTGTDKTVTGRLRALTLAKNRTIAAHAAAEALRMQESIQKLRDANTIREESRGKIRPDLANAEREHNEVLGERSARTQKIEALTAQRSRLDNDLKGKREQSGALVTERDALDLAARQAAWGETSQAASNYLLSLPEHDQRRRTGDWNDDACHQLNEVVRLCFAEDTPHEQMTAEIRELLVEQRWRRGGLDIRVALAPALLRACEITTSGGCGGCRRPVVGCREHVGRGPLAS